MTPTDNEIVRQSLDDPHSFAILFDRHYVAIHAYFSRRVPNNYAEDLAAEVFRVAFERRHSFDVALGDVRGWLFGISRNLRSRQARDDDRQGRAVTKLRNSRCIDDFSDQVDDRIDASNTHARVVDRLDQLSEPDREALILYAVDQLSYAEVALAMDTPIGTVRSRISRARSHLQPVLADWPRTRTSSHSPSTSHMESPHA